MKATDLVALLLPMAGVPIAEATGACPDNWPYLLAAYLLGVVVPAPKLPNRRKGGDGDS